MDIRNTKYLVKHAFEVLGVGRKNSDTKEQYFFIHIPKTAGTSFLMSIYNAIPQQHIYPNYYEYALKNKSRYLSLNELKEKGQLKVFQNYEWVCGHFSLEDTQYFKSDPVTICFFRNPVNRMISQLAHLKEKNNKYTDYTIEEILDARKMNFNLQASKMGFKPSLSNIEFAIENLYQLDFIGISENFSKSMQLFNESYQTQLEVDHQKNRSSKEILQKIREDYSDMIHEKCAHDWMIYNKAKEIFVERLKLAFPDA